MEVQAVDNERRVALPSEDREGSLHVGRVPIAGWIGRAAKHARNWLAPSELAVEPRILSPSP